MAGPLEGRVAVVSGGAGPVGRTVATALSEAGARVAVLDRDAAATGDLDALGIRSFPADVADGAQVERALDRVAAELGEVDVLVTNAGHRVSGSFLALREVDLRRCLEVDVKGALLCMQQVARRLLERGAPGRLVLLTSVAGLRAVPGSCAHSIAKAMTATIAQVTALELGGEGITCNVIATGWTESGFLEERVDRDLAIAATPTGRLTEAIEVGAVCAFLSSAAAGGVNGAVIPVDGGYAIAKSPGGSPIRMTGDEQAVRRGVGR
jgi:NAD(P)-dependent dehydrogenase (short-subunit alcohol dehydrogenase family)